jgi:hypothetical protein
MFDKITSKSINRRSLLSGVALFGAGIALAGCSTDQISSAQSEWATIIGEIQSAVANSASYVPTVESIAETAASLFGPQYDAIVVAGSAALNTIISTLTSVVAVLSPPAAGRLMLKLQGSSPSTPVTIGVTSSGVVVHGYKA